MGLNLKYALSLDIIFLLLFFLFAYFTSAVSNIFVVYPDNDNCHWKQVRRKYSMLQTMDFFTSSCWTIAFLLYVVSWEIYYISFSLKKKRCFLLLLLLRNIVGGKLTSHHTSIPYFLKLSRPDSLLYDFSFKRCYKGYAQEEALLE